jgi:hypothetical protein
VSTIIGSVFGLLVGQWLGRVLWDCLTKSILHSLRKIEKCADTSKACLIILALIVYILGTASFGTIFYFFVKIGDDDNNIIGACVGGGIGLFCAVLAYRKSSSCQTGQQTPMVRGYESSINPPELTLT